METKLEKEVRFLKIYALVATLFGAVFILTAFTVKSNEHKFEEMTAKQIKIVDSKGKFRVLMRAELKGNNSVGLLFFNEDGHENGALFYNGKRDKDGKIDAGAMFTMDQFKSDQIVTLQYDHIGDKLLGK